jgi:excisionase family DNA binding protein
VQSMNGVDSVLEQIESGKGPLTVAQLATIYGVSEPAIYKAIRRGKIPVIDMGMDVVRIDRKSLAYQLRHNNPAMRAAARG